VIQACSKQATGLHTRFNYTTTTFQLIITSLQEYKLYFENDNTYQRQEKNYSSLCGILK